MIRILSLLKEGKTIKNAKLPFECLSTTVKCPTKQKEKYEKKLNCESREDERDDTVKRTYST